MVISWHTDHFVIKTKSAEIVLSDSLRVGENELPGPGEYDIGDIFIESLPFPETPRTAVLVRTEGVTVAWIPALAGSLSEKSVETLDGIDALVLPLSGELTGEVAQVVIKTLEPKIVVYRDDGTGAEISKQGIQVDQTKAFKLTSAVVPQEGIHFVAVS